jgi:hypothetical protein
MNNISRSASHPLKKLYVLSLNISAVWVMDVMQSDIQYHNATGDKISLYNNIVINPGIQHSNCQNP